MYKNVATNFSPENANFGKIKNRIRFTFEFSGSHLVLCNLGFKMQTLL